MLVCFGSSLSRSWALHKCLRDLYPSYLAARAEFDSKSDLVTQYFEKGLDAVAAVSAKWIKRRLMVAASVGFGFGQPDLGSVRSVLHNTNRSRLVAKSPARHIAQQGHIEFLRI